MRHFFTERENLTARIKQSGVLLCLDYDGTLTPIVERPEMAKLPSETLKVLEKLNQTPNLKLAVISGRPLPELRRFVPIPDLLAVGNHGFEIEGPKINHVHPAAKEAAGLLADIRNQLNDLLKPGLGAWVEDKTYTLSVHYRQVDERNVPKVQKILQDVAAPALQTGKLKMTEGKKVWELRPSVDWNKGTSLLWLLGRMEAHTGKEWMPIFIGDDRTDEDAFQAVKAHGLGIRVTVYPEEHTAADYYLTSSGEVCDCLQWILQLKTDAKKER